MRKLLFTMVFLAGCGQPPEAGNDSAAASSTAGTASTAARLTRLTGLYEGGNGQQPNQLCIIEGQQARFGLVVWGSNLHSCSGSGTAVREGEKLSLRMAGDETCTIEASISGTTIVLPDSVPDGCAYYCGQRASLERASFTQKGTTVEDARKAKDLVGDPLCTGG